MMLVLAGQLLLGSWLSAAPVWGQVELEPNDPCPSAQNFGPISLPWALNGNLDSSVDPDVDFFRIRGTPGMAVRIDLEGQSTGQGTLPDPYLGAFDSDCNLIAADDDGGDNVNSRLDLPVPANGLLILGVTECCDGGFQGGGNGTYLLSVQESTAIGSITGRLIDALTGLGIPGYYPVYGRAELRLCLSADCASSEDVASSYVDDESRFSFVENYFGEPLEPGRYEVRAFAERYEEQLVGPFDVASGQSYDVGDIALTPIPTIGSIAGRVIDAVTGEPLVALVDYAYVDLLLCTDYCYTVGSTSLDEDSRFLFTEDFSGLPLQVGSYQIRVSADQYRDAETDLFDVGAGENYDLGDIGINALTVGFSDVVPCKSVPREGGLCRFSVRVTNRLSNGLFGGKAWALVDGSSIGSVLDYTTFQLSHEGSINLAPGESRVVEFAYWVPTTVDNGAYLCVRAYAGEATPNAFFGTVGTADLFCMTKGFAQTFSPLPPGQSRALFDRLRGRTSGLLPRPQR
jgi:hypothetical protein